MSLQDFDIIEDFQANWNSYPKNKVWEIKCRNKTIVLQLAFEVSGGLQVLLQLFIGIRNGLVEQLTVVDPTKSILIDRLVFTDASNEGYLLDIRDLRQRRPQKDKQEIIEFLKHEMEHKLAEIIKNTADRYGESRFRSMKKHISDSLSYAYSGGIPGTGKRR